MRIYDLAIGTVLLVSWFIFYAFVWRQHRKAPAGEAAFASNFTVATVMIFFMISLWSVALTFIFYGLGIDVSFTKLGIQ
ncbi:MAG: hypothetical protein U1E97_11890 [Alphaproteobacteria bacterium]